MREFIVFLGLIIVTSSAFAEKVMGNYMGESNGPTVGSTVCTYQTYNNFTFSVIVNNSICPMSMYYDTNTGMVSENGY